MDNMDNETIKSELATKGFVIIPDILNQEEIDEYKDLHRLWRGTIPNHDKLHNSIDPHGIYKFWEIGNQEFAWSIRTNPKVQAIFKYLWNCEKLISSFDGSCYISKDTKKVDKLWTHTDQAPNRKGLECYQGLVALTSNKERTLVVYENSHLMHHLHFKSKGINSSKNWQIIDKDTIDSMKPLKRVLDIPAGALVLWDSRTFHQNQYGKPNSEERLVQYVCYLPDSHKINTQSMKTKRLKYFYDRRTTSHWPTPISVNGLQPQTYGDSTKNIDYSKLVPPDLDDLQDQIMELL
jgi:hypothetical protein